MKDLIGRWRVESGPFAGSIYHFKKDGSFELLNSIHIRGAGRYRVFDQVAPFEIAIHFVQHTAPEQLGLVKGFVSFRGERLHLKLGPPDGDYWIEPKSHLICARA